MYDLIVSGGRVVDPATGFDGPADVIFDQGQVVEVGPGLSADQARARVDATGKLVVPGLIDLHTHVYWGGTSLGVDADSIARRSGTTTFIDAGSSGPGNFLGFRRHVMERSRVRILAYLNISFAGIYAFSEAVMVGECADLRLLDARETARVAAEHLDRLVGVKVRAGRTAGGASGIAPLDICLEAADRLQLPVMAHLDYPPPSRLELVSRLRRGDILTHCFKPFPNAPVDGRNQIRAEILAARERGVVFDIGHGAGSFDFDTARAMLKGGFLPDVISSDVHTLCIDGPAYDNLVTMSKFLCLGLPLPDVIGMATTAPAAAIARPDLGRLTPGTPGDAAILDLHHGSFDYVDVRGQTLKGDQQLTCHGIVTAGTWWPSDETSAA